MKKIFGLIWFEHITDDLWICKDCMDDSILGYVEYSGMFNKMVFCPAPEEKVFLSATYLELIIEFINQFD